MSTPGRKRMKKASFTRAEVNEQVAKAYERCADRCQKNSEDAAKVTSGIVTLEFMSRVCWHINLTFREWAAAARRGVNK